MTYKKFLGGGFFFELALKNAPGSPIYNYYEILKLDKLDKNWLEEYKYWNWRKVTSSNKGTILNTIIISKFSQLKIYYYPVILL